MLNAIGTALSSVIGWFGQVITSLLQEATSTASAGALHGLLIPLCISCALGLVFVVFRLIKRVTWGV